MTIGLLSYHSDFSTSEYFRRAISQTGQKVVLLGPIYPHRSNNVCPDVEELVHSMDLDSLLFVDPPGPFWPRSFESYRKLKIAYLIDVHQSLDVRLNYAPFFDQIFIAQKDYVEEFHKRGFENASWVPLGCDPALHVDYMVNRVIDVGFVGKLGQLGDDRYKTLIGVLPKFKTNDFRRFYSPEEMAKVYGSSKIGFNKSINGDLNMRFFEVLASGALLITDRISNGVSDLFQEGVHYIGYSSVEEAVDKINYYLENEEARDLIASRGQKAVLHHHTYVHRWQLIQNSSVGTARVHFYDEIQCARAYAKVYQQLRLPQGIWPLVRGNRKFVHKMELFFRYIISLAMKINSIVPFTPRSIMHRFLKR